MKHDARRNDMLKKPLVIATTAAALAVATLSTQASAADPLAGALIGGGIGAAIGHGAGGRNGAAVGGVLGAIVGSSIAADSGYYGGPGRYGSSGYYAPAPAYYAPAPAYYEPAPVYYEPAPVYYGPSVVFETGHYGHRYYGHRAWHGGNGHRWH
jgi:hypothetical protein